MTADAVVIGGGPAGAAVARLLASWGHAVHLLTRPPDHSRGLAESLPPSTHKLLHAIGVLDAIDRAGFYRSTGNTVWWASRDRRVELFDSSGRARGYQVFRPALDRVLLDCARAGGVAVIADARVRRVAFDTDRVDVHFDADGRAQIAACRIVIDASGRAGVVAKRYRRPEPGHRMYALVGVWHDDEGGRAKPSGDRSVDPTHTLVETYDDGWAWSVPISPTVRHVGLMTSRGARGRSPGDAASAGVAIGDYRSELAKARAIAEVVRDARLERVFACDASLYSSSRYAGPQFLLVGDAASFIDPLSSFGVKKALASAWVGAIAAHTCLADPDRRPIAAEFFTRWEQEAYAAHVRRSHEFARAAHAEHPQAFWALRAERDEPDGGDDEGALARDPAVLAAFERFKAHDDFELTDGQGIALERRPVIRGHEIVLEDTFGGLRFFANVDLVKLADVARRHRRVPDVFEAYCAAHQPVPLPNVMGALSLLVAKGILAYRV